MRKQRGFTLIELMITVGVGTILSTTFFSIMYWQDMQYYEHLDSIDAHQNARAALNIMRRYVRSARYGLAADANATGAVPIGMCFNSATTGSQYNCHNVDTSNNDRLRVEFLNYDPNTFVQNPNYSAGGKCDGSGSVSPPITAIATQGNPNMAASVFAGQLAGIGGKCVDSNSGNPANDLVWISSDSGAANGCTHRYTFTVADGTYSGGSQLSCNYPAASGANTDSGYTFGLATIADFYIYQDPNNGPELVLRTNPRSSYIPNAATSPNTFIVAYGIERLQVTYGIDLSSAASSFGRTANTWVQDLRTSANGGSLVLTDSGGTTLTQQQIFNRIVAVRLMVGVRTDQARKGLAGSSDGYRHYTYSTTVSLRNDSI